MLRMLRRAADVRIERCVAAWLALHRSAFAVPLPEQAAHDCLTIVRALVEASPGGCDAGEQLPARVARALLEYLCIER
jgi:hypothetical protein